MKIEVTQDSLKYNFSYRIKVDDETLFYGEINRTLLPQFRKILLRNKNGKIVAALNEVNHLYKLISSIPIINLFLFKSKFLLQIEEEVCGEAFSKANIIQAKASIIFNNSKYMIYEHTNEGIYRYSIFLEEEQIGMIVRSPYTEWGNDTYIGEFSKNTNKILNSILILFIDALWHTVDIPTEVSYSSIKYERGLDSIFGVKLNKEWKPKNN